ncbi:MAG TPA: cbb3-type cytochrome c oxidase subunit I [Solirubrobacterales bacterium]|nr:cbb3-type cytochrome c oxidase subunit I [Solirubrobacterales bacterium]
MSPVADWIRESHHEAIGRRVIATGIGFFALAGFAALLVRIQLAVPGNHFLSAGAYDQLFTEHGMTMLLFFAVPVMEGIALVFVPKELGADDAALPRLAAFAFWLFLFAAATAWVALAFGEAPNSGWFSYLPLASPRFQPGQHSDVYAVTVILSQVATTLLAVVLVTTILARRAKGMAPHLMPLLGWATLVAAAMVLLAMPALIVDATLLSADSKFGTHFFDPAGGGDPLLWQHLFWFFGHPLVYLMLLPGLGIVSTLTATFARRPMVGYPFIVASYLMIGTISFGVWAHHMFATGEPEAGLTLFSIATFAVAIPSGVHVFAVLATLWRGRVSFEPPMLYVFGFVAVFVMGGITGVMVGSFSADRQLTDTYFVVAHFHYVLLGGVLLPILGALHYWWPKLTGWMPGRGLGILAFWLIFAGIQLTFFPMHIAGLEGMSRRIHTYPDEHDWSTLNLLSTIGAFTIGLGLAVFAANLLRGLRRFPAPVDPWGTGTLDALEKVPAVVRTRYPAWEQREEVEAGRPLVPPLRPPTPMPFVAALLTAFAVVGLIWDPLLAALGGGLALVAIVAWLSTPLADGERLPPLGVALGLVPVAAATAALVSAWWFLDGANDEWPLSPVEPRPLLFGALLTLLVGSAVAGAWVAGRREGRGRNLALVLAALAAALFVGVQVLELGLLDYDQANNASGSIDWLLSISFALLVAVFALGALLIGTSRPERTRARLVLSESRQAVAVEGLALLAGLLALGWPLVALTTYLGARL